MIKLRSNIISCHPSTFLRHCGLELAYVLRDKLEVKRSGAEHEEEDLRIWSARTSDILFLVNMPKCHYTQDSKGFWDTTKAKFLAHMREVETSPMLAQLQLQGYQTRVHKTLSCPDLIARAQDEVINVTWIFSYQVQHAACWPAAMFCIKSLAVY